MNVTSDHDTSASPAKVADLASDIKFAMLTTVDADGELVSRPMAHQEVEADGDLWFFSSRDSRKVEHVRSNPHVAVTLASSSTWVSINGSAAVVDDVEKAKELWSVDMEAWFPQGPEDPSIVLIKVSGETAEYWDGPGGRVSSVLSLAKSKLTGQRYSGGENEKVDLGTAD
ncbi:pyridoxamine 5'-phosphate oxidase family protein [Microlunatus spumicola]|uniref:Pyridoxamine 5'-phosphate oxidase family protein n=1 Tax=Microlunatus spumicola TaxID=81499 RepID=A0ABP6XX10_9ACTN